jgi:dihydroxy-acid dehydratase
MLHDLRHTLHGSARAADGRTWRDHVASAPETQGQKVIVSSRAPFVPSGGLAVLRKSLPPDRSVVEVASASQGPATLPARLFAVHEGAVPTTE